MFTDCTRFFRFKEERLIDTASRVTLQVHFKYKFNLSNPDLGTPMVLRIMLENTDMMSKYNHSIFQDNTQDD